MNSRVDDPIFCERCLKNVLPGSGNFFEIRLVAIADPYSPQIPDQDKEDAKAEYEKLVDQLATISASEAMENIALGRTFDLCNSCFKVWIEDPCGSLDR